MDIKYEQQEGTLRIILSGELTETEAYHWQMSFKDAISDNVSLVILDCADLKYITSSGLRVILLIQKEMNIRDGELVVEHVQPAVMDVFRTVGFSNFLNIKP